MRSAKLMQNRFSAKTLSKKICCTKHYVYFEDGGADSPIAEPFTKPLMTGRPEAVARRAIISVMNGWRLYFAERRQPFM